MGADGLSPVKANAKLAQAAIVGAILLLTLLTWYQFPGHTYLTSDSQIYVPILERRWDPTVLSRDLVATFPHVAYTIYDEVALGARKIFGGTLESVLESQQFLSRAAGIFGVFLLAHVFCESAAIALLVSAIFSLGAYIASPSLMTFEYEPVPRATAIPLSLLALGLLSRGRPLAAAVAASVAFLYHPAVLYPFWTVYGFCALRPPGKRGRRPWLAGLAILLCSAALLLAFSRQQTGGSEPMSFLGRLDPAREELMRLRAPYNWISSWGLIAVLHHVALWALAALAYVRLRREAAPEVKPFLAGLPLIGLISMPASYLLLEKWHWDLMPQSQPMRALLYVTALAVILGALAGVEAARRQRHVEGALWFALALALCTNVHILRVAIPGRSLENWTRSIVLVLLGAAACRIVSAFERGLRWAGPALATLALVPFLVLPRFSHLEDRVNLSTPALEELCAWAGTSTPKDALFHFAGAEQTPYPGFFRAKALRAVYVDWKGGGQINFFSGFQREWLARWKATAERDGGTPASFKPLGIDFVVIRAPRQLPGSAPVFANADFVVYRTSDSD